jgi:FHA domain
MVMPCLRIGGGEPVVPLLAEVTTVGCGGGADVRLADPTVSVLHAELVRRGPYVYVADMGLSANGTTVNGRPVTRRLLADADVICFGAAMCQIGGIAAMPAAGPVAWQRPELTRRETDVLAALCRPALAGQAFCQPASVREIAGQMAVTEAAVKQHLLRLYGKFGIPGGRGQERDRRIRLANAAAALGYGHATPPGAAVPPGASPPAKPTAARDAWMIDALLQGASIEAIAEAAGIPAATAKRRLQEAGAPI